MSIKDTAEKAGHKIAETASKVGHRIAEGAEKAADWVKEKTHQAGNRAKEAAQKTEHAAQECRGGSKTEIQEHMNVITSCGCKVGTVDRVEGGSIKLTKQDSPDGQHHLIPLSWVGQVDKQVHLLKNHEEITKAFKADTVGCCAG